MHTEVSITSAGKSRYYSRGGRPHPSSRTRSANCPRSHPPVRASCEPCAVKMTRPSVCGPGCHKIKMMTREKCGRSVRPVHARAWEPPGRCFDSLGPPAIARQGPGAFGVPPLHQTWAMLIKRLYEIDPLACPEGGKTKVGQMKVITFIEPPQSEVIETVLRGHLSGATMGGLSHASRAPLGDDEWGPQPDGRLGPPHGHFRRAPGTDVRAHRHVGRDPLILLPDARRPEDVTLPPRHPHLICGLSGRKDSSQGSRRGLKIHPRAGLSPLFR